MAHVLRENVLADNVPVVAGKLYSIDGKPKIATVSGLVSDLKTALGASVVKNFDWVGGSPGWLDNDLGA
jgi:hypothetical protein